MERHHQAQQLFLHPGEYAVATAPCSISTLLGSCVSIVLWHPATKTGAMSHFILPSRRAGDDSSPSGRYGDEVLDLMLYDLAALGVPSIQCQASIYGGGSMYPVKADTSFHAVGQRNGAIARRMLAARGIPVVAASLYGSGFRKITFDVQSGQVTSLLMPVEEEHAGQAVVNRIGEQLGTMLFGRIPVPMRTA